MKVAITLTEEEIREAVLEWLDNNYNHLMEEENSSKITFEWKHDAKETEKLLATVEYIIEVEITHSYR